MTAPTERQWGVMWTDDEGLDEGFWLSATENEARLTVATVANKTQRPNRARVMSRTVQYGAWEDAS